MPEDPKQIKLKIIKKKIKKRTQKLMDCILIEANHPWKIKARIERALLDFYRLGER